MLTTFALPRSFLSPGCQEWRIVQLDAEQYRNTEWEM
jgi:hypothetical protein